MFEQIGNWNPQFIREVKGRLKGRNVAIASMISLASQLLLFFSYQSSLPQDLTANYSAYCILTKRIAYEGQVCLKDSSGQLVINWPKWWLDIFFWLSWWGIFALMLGGVYLLISDLDKEEKRGTLNFIRLSPQHPQKLLIGKLLGVPILFYFGLLLVVPFHIYAGLSAQIPLHQIVVLQGITLVSCVCVYSLAMLFGLVTNWLGGFQAWLAIGMMGFFLMMTSHKEIINTSADLFNVLSPLLMLKYTISQSPVQFENLHWFVRNQHRLDWFFQPIGNSSALVASLSLLTYGVITYFCWQGLQRRLPSQTMTILRKKTSYLATILGALIIAGFTWQRGSSTLGENVSSLLAMNGILIISLLIAITPDRQTLFDWARYRHATIKKNQRFPQLSLIQDLVWGEKSPPILALAINLMLIFCINFPALMYLQKSALLSLTLLFGFNLMLIYASLAQLLLLMKNSQQAAWAFSVVSGMIFLPPMVLCAISVNTNDSAITWLISTFPIFWGWEAIEYASISTLVFATLAQWSAIVLLNFQLSRQLQKAGESATKALLASC